MDPNESKRNNPTPGGKPRIATLSSLNQTRRPAGHAPPSSRPDDEGQSFYVGGSQSSGQQILGGADRGGNVDQMIKSMFQAARDHGAQLVPNSDTPPEARRVAPFKGRGNQLSQDSQGSSSSHPVNEDDNVSSDEEPVLRRLKMWRNGFSIDDGPLRGYDDEQNREFLDSVSRGEIPRELVIKNRSQTSIHMEDHHTEDFVPPKHTLKTFHGEGQRLGNVTPETIIPPTNEEVNQPPQIEKAKENLKVDTSKPVTSVQVRLTNGTRLKIEVNLTNTISDIRSYICDALPFYGPRPFQLMTSFPNRVLTDETETIADAKLQNALIVQKLV